MAEQPTSQERKFRGVPPASLGALGFTPPGAEAEASCAAACASALMGAECSGKHGSLNAAGLNVRKTTK